MAVADPPAIFRKSRLLSSLSMLSVLYLGSAGKWNDVVHLRTSVAHRKRQSKSMSIFPLNNLNIYRAR